MDDSEAPNGFKSRNTDQGLLCHDTEPIRVFFIFDVTMSTRYMCKWEKYLGRTERSCSKAACYKAYSCHRDMLRTALREYICSPLD